MAAGNQAEKGICALLVVAVNIKKEAMKISSLLK
jgi:hypothetical protein